MKISNDIPIKQRNMRSDSINLGQGVSQYVFLVFT